MKIKKILTLSTAALALFSLAACSAGKSHEKSTSTQSSAVKPKPVNITGTWYGTHEKDAQKVEISGNAGTYTELAPDGTKDVKKLTFNPDKSQIVAVDTKATADSSTGAVKQTWFYKATNDKLTITADKGNLLTVNKATSADGKTAQAAFDKIVKATELLPLNLAEISQGNFASMAGTWKNARGTVLVIDKSGHETMPGTDSEDNSGYNLSGYNLKFEETKNNGATLAFAGAVGGSPAVLVAAPAGVNIYKFWGTTDVDGSNKGQDRLFIMTPPQVANYGDSDGNNSKAEAFYKVSNVTTSAATPAASQTPASSSATQPTGVAALVGTWTSSDPHGGSIVIDSSGNFNYGNSDKITSVTPSQDNPGAETINLASLQGNNMIGFEFYAKGTPLPAYYNGQCGSFDTSDTSQDRIVQSQTGAPNRVVFVKN